MIDRGLHSHHLVIVVTAHCAVFLSYRVSEFGLVIWVDIFKLLLVTGLLTCWILLV